MKIRASNCRPRIDFCYGQMLFLLDLYGSMRDQKMSKVIFSRAIQGSIEDVPRMYHAKSQVLGCRTRRDIGGQSRPFGDPII